MYTPTNFADPKNYGQALQNLRLCTVYSLLGWTSFGMVSTHQDACPFAEMIVQNLKFFLGISTFFSQLFLCWGIGCRVWGQLGTLGGRSHRCAHGERLPNSGVDDRVGGGGISRLVASVALITRHPHIIDRKKSLTGQYGLFKVKTLVLLTFELFRAPLSLLMKRWGNTIQFSGDFLFSHRNESQPQKLDQGIDFKS